MSNSIYNSPSACGRWVIVCRFEDFNLQLPHSVGVDVCRIERDLINHMAEEMPENNQSKLITDQVAIKNRTFIQADSMTRSTLILPGDRWVTSS